MAQKIKYNLGDLIGPYNHVFIEEVESKNGNRKAVFYCPECDSFYVSSISSIKNGGNRGCRCPKIKNIVGQKFGHLTVLEFEGIDTKTRQSLWLVQCDCREKTFFITSQNSLSSGNSTSCGCQRLRTRIERLSKEMIGKKFGKLTVIKCCPDERDKESNLVWECECDCKDHTHIKVGTRSLTDGRVMSCGCINSRGEVKIRNILDALSIKYEKEKSFKNLINPDTGKKLRFDFYLPEYNLCIEYDGKQHFLDPQKNNGMFGKLEETIQRDKVKDNFSIKNNIGIIRIPYTEYNNLSEDYIKNLLS